MNTSADDQSQRGRAVSVWLTDEDIAQLKQIAQEKGIGHTTLVRMWVKAYLKKETQQESTEP
ncbi:MAG: hypothetical protein ABEL51_11055 [Salinibacter sp.]